VLAQPVVDEEAVRWLRTISGVDVITATTLRAVIGDVGRLRCRATWSAISACSPRSVSPGPAPARHGRTSKEGSPAARHVLVEAAWAASRSPDRCACSRNAGPHDADAPMDY
jgi:transposase